MRRRPLAVMLTKFVITRLPLWATKTFVARAASASASPRTSMSFMLLGFSKFDGSMPSLSRRWMMFSASFKSARVPATTMLFDSGSAETVTRRMGWLRASKRTIAFETTPTTLMAVALLSLKNSLRHQQSQMYSKIFTLN